MYFTNLHVWARECLLGELDFGVGCILNFYNNTMHLLMQSSLLEIQSLTIKLGSAWPMRRHIMEYINLQYHAAGLALFAVAAAGGAVSALALEMHKLADC